MIARLISKGVSEEEFKKYFAKCNCKVIVFRERFLEHICAVPLPPSLPEIIDISSDDDSDTTNESQAIVIDISDD